MIDGAAVTQDELGRYRHKALLRYKDGGAQIFCTQLFPDPSGCWTCISEIFADNGKTFHLQGMHPKHKVLIYTEVP